MAIIAVSNFKGGVGKSTTAIALGTLLAPHGSVVVLDADQNQSCLQWASAGHLPFAVLTEAAARKKLASGEFTHIIIDAQAQPATGEIKALCEGSDLLIVPTTPEALVITATGKVWSECPSGASVRALIYMVPPKPQRDGIQVQKVLQKAGVPTFKHMIRRSKEYSKAAEVGADMSTVSGRMVDYWKDWVLLFSELMEILEDA